MKRILTTALVLLVALGLGITALHSHQPGQDCNICKYVSPATTAVLTVTVASAITRTPEFAFRTHAAPLSRRSYRLSLLRAPPIA